MVKLWKHFGKCWDRAKYHWLAAVVVTLAVAYSALTEWAVLTNLPHWLRPDTWPKLPLPYAFAVFFAAIAFIAIEGGRRYHYEEIKIREARIEELTWPNECPRISIESCEHEQGTSRWAFYIVNDGDTALDVVVERFQGGNWWISSDKLPRLSANSKSFIPIFLEDDSPINRDAFHVALAKTRSCCTTLDNALK